MAKNLFLTGRVKCGKSTLIKQEITPFLGHVGGYFVQRIFCSGQHCGFKMVELLDQESYILEKEFGSINEEKDLVVYLSENGCWKTCINTFEETGVEILERSYNSGKKVILMDELGRVERFAPRFQNMVHMLLDDPVYVLGVLKKEENLFLDGIRERNDVFVIDLDIWDYQEAVEKVHSFLVDVFVAVMAKPGNDENS
ncbi:MAG: nucleoside-triphosphatase [Syntrophaceticus sp.]